MAKVFIEETTLTAIGDAIRSKTGKTELIDPANMSTEIEAIEAGTAKPRLLDYEITENGVYNIKGSEYEADYDGFGVVTVNCPPAPTDYELQITGNCSYRFAKGGWDWFINKYGDKMTTASITDASYMFQGSKVKAIPFQINISNCDRLDYLFGGCTELKTCPKVRGTIKWGTSTTFNNGLMSMSSRDLEDLFTPEMIEGFSTVKVTSAYSAPKAAGLLSQNGSLRRIPSWWYKFRLNEESTAFPTALNSLYNSAINYNYVLDEAPNIPVWRCQGAQTGGMFSYTFKSCNRLKSITFETNADGSPIETKWKAQVIDLTDYVGYTSYSGYITAYNSGITADKEVKDDATYQALKDDPDWFTTKMEYSRYNHDSAVETINSLPDTSAYLATAGGTNTIMFKGKAGRLTDGGAINTLTEEEIAVATAKGWTVSLV